ncbi:MAG: M6 family metalloprotease domain-containing protein [Bacteroidetes bacterium]|nr:M6 family metalloprotease domain-containing protein [Bacteroidota bacterium]
MEGYKLNILTITIVLICFTLLPKHGDAVTANPARVEYTQPDGTSLILLLKGDECIHWATTLDGYTILSNKQGFYEYASPDSTGNLGFSGIQAHNDGQRSQSEQKFLRGIRKGLFFSETQVNEMKQWQVNKNIMSPMAPMVGGFPTTGTRKLLQILANFSNTTTTYSQADFDSLMNQVNYNGTGSFRDYYLEVSYGQLTVNTTVTIWVNLPQTHDYYGPQAKWGEFAYDAVVAADVQAAVNFAEFDNNSDGIVDGVAIIHQGRGQEESGNINDIWSHSWDLSSAGYTVAQRTFDGVQVLDYTTMPEKNGPTNMTTIGVICHEFGHNLGSPDFYDTDYGNFGQYDGTGNWDVMAHGSWNGASGSQPAHPNAWIKDFFTWTNPTILTTEQISLLRDARLYPDVFRYNTTTTNEYFLCENRQQTGFDAGLPGHGLMIYHIDGNYIAAHTNTNDINANSHQGMFPMSAIANTANGVMPSFSSNINTGGCPWPGTESKTTFSDGTMPNSKSWAGANTDKPLLGITENMSTNEITVCFIACDTVHPVNFTATAVSSSQINLSWIKNPSNDSVMVAFSLTSAFGIPVTGNTYASGDTIPGGGNVLYNGSNTFLNHTVLSPITTYYYMAWSVITDTTYSTGVTANATTFSSIPTVTTSPVSNITYTSATGGGNVTSAGDSTVTARGVCWSTIINPTISDNHTTDSSGTGTFISSISGLDTNTIYYVRAYAINSLGTAYGNVLSFGTFSCGSITINHIAGTVAPVTKTVTYYTVTNISGEPLKCWITSNLGADHEATSVDDATEASAGWYWQFNRKQGYMHDGTTLTPNIFWIIPINEPFDWQAQNDPCVLELGIRSGWRIPTFTEWYNVDVDGSWTNWNGPWNSGLKLHAAGYINICPVLLRDLGVYGVYWSGMQYSESTGDHLIFTSESCNTFRNDKRFGNTIRCLDDYDTSFTIPWVTTNLVCSITHTSAISEGSVIYDGGVTVTVRGVCWNTSPYPTISNSKTIDGSGIGTFTSTITGLDTNTIYYFRAYATNIVGTSYGNDVIFTTLPRPCPGVPTVTYEENTYNTVQIGQQCWLIENLNIGEMIPESQAQSDNDTIEKYCNGNLESNCDVYGGLYQWDELMQYVTTQGVQGICPIGWHIPSYEDFTLLTDNLGGLSDAGGKMKEMGLNHWAWPNIGATNSSGFTAIAGGFLSDPGLFVPPTFQACFWPSSENVTTNAWSLYLNYGNNNALIYDYWEKTRALSVRCVMNAPNYPTVTTNNVMNISQTNAVSGGNVIEDGGFIVTERGVCWSTSSNPTIYDNHTIDEAQTGEFLSNISGLTKGTIYFLRAYATNSVGTAYGNKVKFASLLSPDECGNTITYEGKTYNTIQIGIQCWFKENLNIGTQIDTKINQTNNGIIEKYCYNNLETNCTVYGGLYQWNEMMQYATTEEIQGICPTGWHIPSNTEWWNLSNYLGSFFVVGGLLKETGFEHWLTPNTGATNSSGFNAIPGGLYEKQYSLFTYLTTYAHFWSSSEYDTANAKGWYLQYNSNRISWSNFWVKSYGFSVRCLKDSCDYVGISIVASANPVCEGTSVTFTATPTNGGTTPSYQWKVNGTYVGTDNPIYTYTPAANDVITCVLTSSDTLCITGNPATSNEYNSIAITTSSTLTTTVVSYIGQTTATSGGEVMNDGCVAVMARGVCWSTLQNPTVEDDHTADGNGTGVFVSNLTGLTLNTLYYVRAYSTDSVGTAYGNEMSFSTSFFGTCGYFTIIHVADTIAPVDKTVTYGTVTNIPGEPSKCWITSNLGADHQATSVDDATEASAGWYWQFNRKQGYKHDGTNRTPNSVWITSINENLDWQAANDPCTLELGSGWRIPTSTEWTNVDAIGNWTDWNDPWNSGLKLHAAGILVDGNGWLVERGGTGFYWSSVQGSANHGGYLFFWSGDSYIVNNQDKAYGCSLRCLKDTCALPSEQVINIQSGWGGISSYVDAVNDSVTVLFEPIISDLTILMSMSQLYWPGQGINTIGTWNTHQGYKIKVNNTVQVTFSGEPDANKTLDLNSGWSIIPVLNNDLVDASQLFDPLGDTLIIVKEIAGIKLYWPGQSIYTLVNLEPGKAYMVATNAACSVTFPAYVSNPYKTVSAGEVFVNVTPWNDALPSPNSHTIAIDKSLLSQCKPGDVIGVFNNSGLCCGMISLGDLQSNTAITAFGDDNTTGITDGFVEDEIMSFRLYRPGIPEEFHVFVTYDQLLPDKEFFTTNGLSKIAGINLVPTSSDLSGIEDCLTIYPNPTGGIIYLTNHCLLGEVDIKIYNDHGQLVMDDHISYTTLHKTYQIDLTGLRKGVYVVKLTGIDFVGFKKVVKY